MAVETSANGDAVAGLEARTERALTEYMAVLPEGDGTEMFTVVGQNGGTYTVDGRESRCTCPDHEYRSAECKHIKRVKYATGAKSIPERVNSDDIDPQLGIHTDDTLRRVAVADGGSEESHRDEETLRRLYQEKRLTIQQMADRLDVSLATVHKWMSRHDIERREHTNRIKPGTHRDENTLRRLYHDEKLTQKEVAEELGCSVTSVKEWMNRHGIERRDAVAASKAAQRVEYATYLTKPSGYETWATRHNGGMDWVYVHRLLAVAVYGFDAVCGSVVHHRNKIKWDNRPGNLKLMERGEHTNFHNLKDPITPDGGVRLATGDRPVPDGLPGVDPQLGAHVDVDLDGAADGGAGR